MGRGSLTRRGTIKGLKPVAALGGLEGPYLPEGSGDAQSPEELRALEIYETRMRAFDHLVELMGRRPKRRNTLNDYATKNCEEAWGNR